MNPQAYRHIFFDLDGTVTRSRSLITPEMTEALHALLASGRDVIIVSGAAVTQSLSQTDNLPLLYLGQNGNHAYDGARKTDIWREFLTETEKNAIFDHIASIPRTWEVTDERDLIEDRGSQISYSLLGHHEDVSKKEKFDPKGDMRKRILSKHPLDSDTIQVVIGGTTCFDYIRRGRHKGYNVSRLIEENRWNKDACVYVGDALFKGGNDETVIGVIDTKQVASPVETLAFVNEILGR